MSHEQLDGPGSNIKFWRRRMSEVEDGLILLPGPTVEKVVQALRTRKFEAMLGSNLLTIHPARVTRTAVHSGQSLVCASMLEENGLL